MSEKIEIKALMQKSGVKFGTSGARGLAAAMTNGVCHAYTTGFLSFLEEIGELESKNESVAIAGDLRPSTGAIMAAVAQAIRDKGYNPINCGRIPSPAVALFGLEQGIPAIMVTGSHIPADRNGIKFNKCSGEILKRDEALMMAQRVDYQPDVSVEPLPVEDTRALEGYRARYLSLFPADCLSGLKIGFYQHSAVGREVLAELLVKLGAEVVPLGFSEHFVPVDTEAIRPEDVVLARDWAQQHQLDGIISTDGDSDRPLLSDEQGKWLRGDILGILAASYLEADSISTPVSSNSALEACERFAQVHRTKIGSPFVVAAMQEALADNEQGVVGYEANGGFLTASAFPLFGGELAPLPTRDALLPVLAALLLAKAQDVSLATLVAQLPARFTASDRIEAYPTEQSAAIIERYASVEAIEHDFAPLFGAVDSVDRTDGVRITFSSSEVVHLRPSGNAPEFRCYNEAQSEARVEQMQALTMALLMELKG